MVVVGDLSYTSYNFRGGPPQNNSCMYRLDYTSTYTLSSEIVFSEFFSAIKKWEIYLMHHALTKYLKK